MTEFIQIPRDETHVQLYWTPLERVGGKIEEYVTYYTCDIPIRHKYTHHLCSHHDIVLMKQMEWI